MLQCILEELIMTNTLKKFKNNIENILNIAQEKNLNGREISMLVAIVDLQDNDQEQCFASNTTLAQKVNLSPNRVSATLRKLERKQLVKMEHYRQGTSLTVNEKNYLVYRTITFNHQTQPDVTPLTENDKGGLPKTVRGVLPKTVTKSTKVNSTNSKYTKNLSKDDSVNNHPVVAKQDAERDSEYQKMLQLALEQTKQRKNIGSIHAYAKMIVKNWFKDGLTTLQAVKDTLGHAHNAKPHFEEKLPSWATDPQVQTVPDDETTATTSATAQNKQVQADIQALMNKINQRTVSSSLA